MTDLSILGPWVSSAFFCEKVLNEVDGVPSFIRVIDRITQQAAGPDVPLSMPPVALNTNLVVSLKSGAALGSHQLQIRPEAPSGERLPQAEFPVHFEGGERGNTIVMQMNIALEEEGLYWFDIFLDEGEVPLTRVPFRVVYQPTRTTFAV